MKGNLLFAIMYVLTVLAYPIVFMYSKLYQQYSMLKESINPTNLFVVVSVTQVKNDQLKIYETGRQGNYAYSKD